MWEGKGEREEYIFVKRERERKTERERRLGGQREG